MKAIVFATKMGGGHMSAAQAVADTLDRRGCKAQVCDFLTLTGRRTSDIVGGAYVKLVQHSPAAFGRIYRAGQLISSPHIKSVVYLANTLYATTLSEYIAQYSPDVLLTSHIFAAQALTHLRRTGAALPPTIGIMTDYTCAPFWEETELDAYITPHPALNAEFEARHMPSEKLHPLGIPVSPDCLPTANTAQAKCALGLDPLKPHLLVIGGSMGAGNLGQVLAALDGIDAQVTCVCGNNSELRDELSAQYAGRDGWHIDGYVKPLFPIMDASDVVLSKSGGLTSTEIMTKRLPFVVINPIVGVETRNATFFEQLGVALYARSDCEIREYAERLLNDCAARARMLEAQQRNVRIDASSEIAEFALKLAQHGDD